MQAVILAAGRGTRMGALTEHLPKPLIEVAGKTLLEHKFDALPEEVQEIIIIVHYLGDMIRARFGEEYKGKKITYIDQDALDGTGGALWRAKDLLRGRFLVMNGDDIYAQEDIQACTSAESWAVLCERRELREKGKVILVDDGTVLDIQEGHYGNEIGLINTSFFALDTRFFDIDLVPKASGSSEFGLPQTVIAASRRFNIPLFAIQTEKWIEITSPEDLMHAERLLQAR